MNGIFDKSSSAITCWPDWLQPDIRADQDTRFRSGISSNSWRASEILSHLAYILRAWLEMMVSNCMPTLTAAAWSEVPWRHDLVLAQWCNSKPMLRKLIHKLGNRKRKLLRTEKTNRAVGIPLRAPFRRCKFEDCEITLYSTKFLSFPICIRGLHGARII